jgi:hypothetical protein
MNPQCVDVYCNGEQRFISVTVVLEILSDTTSKSERDQFAAMLAGCLSDEKGRPN